MCVALALPVRQNSSHSSLPVARSRHFCLHLLLRERFGQRRHARFVSLVGCGRGKLKVNLFQTAFSWMEFGGKKLVASQQRVDLSRTSSWRCQAQQWLSFSICIFLEFADPIEALIAQVLQGCQRLSCFVLCVEAQLDLFAAPQQFADISLFYQIAPLQNGYPVAYLLHFIKDV